MNEVSNRNYTAREIDSKTANALIKKYHYSGKVVANSKLHIGIFYKGTEDLAGALSFGYPMNPKKTPGNLVEGASYKDMYELNRMAMTDEAPKFSESQAIGLSIRWLKRFRPDIKWLLSFSDGKEGNVGTIYQATNWDYYGYIISNSFFDLDGEIIHRVTSWHRHREGRTCGRTEREILCELYHNVSVIYSKQHIYIFPLAKDVKVLRDKQPYPKQDGEPRIIRRDWIKKDGVIMTPSKRERVG